jgi:hypothetical protein
LEIRSLSYLINRLLSLALDLELAELPEDDMFREAVVAIKQILLHCPAFIKPCDVIPNPKGGRTLYFSQQVQNRVITELEARNGELWHSIQEWLEKRFQVERASLSLAKKAARSSNGQATCSTTAGVDGNTRGEGGEEGGDEISAAAHVSSGGASGAPAGGLLSVGTKEDALAAIAGDYGSDESEHGLRNPEEKTVAPASVDSGAAAAAAAPSCAASAAVSAASDDGRALENDGVGQILAWNKREGGREELFQNGCRFSVNGRPYTFDLRLHLFNVADNGSCWPIAILRTVAGLDFDALKQVPSLAKVNWSAVEVWAGFGKVLETGQDQECKAFREHACRTLLSNLEICRAFFKNDISNKDISKKNFKKSFDMAVGLGIVLPEEVKLDRAHRWIVSLLYTGTHFAEEHWQALLAVDLGGCLGVLVAVRSERHKADNEVDKFVHCLPSYQPLIDDDAKFLIAVVQQSRQKLSDDSERREAASRPQRKCCPQTPEQLAYKAKAEARWAQSLTQREFMVQYGINHFQGASIVNTTGNALVVAELSSSSHGANPASPVRVAAETEKVADAKATKDPAEANRSGPTCLSPACRRRYVPFLPSEEDIRSEFGPSQPISPSTMWFLRTVAAKCEFRRSADKEDEYGDTTEDSEDEAGGPKSQAGLGGDGSIVLDLSTDSPAGSAVNAVTGSAVKETARRARRILDVGNAVAIDGTPATVSKLTRAGGLDSPGRDKDSSPAADPRSNMQRYSSSHAVVHTRHREAYTIVCSLRSYRRDRASFGPPHGFATVFECEDVGKSVAVRLSTGKKG